MSGIFAGRRARLLAMKALRERYVPAGETANELYHILFGGINEELVRRGLTAAPPDRPGEGRYLQCIKW